MTAHRTQVNPTQLQLAYSTPHSTHICLPVLSNMSVKLIKYVNIAEFQLRIVSLARGWLAGWLVVGKSCRVSAVRAINRLTSERNATARNVLTVYPDESWVLRGRAHE